MRNKNLNYVRCESFSRTATAIIKLYSIFISTHNCRFFKHFLSTFLTNRSTSYPQSTYKGKRHIITVLNRQFFFMSHSRKKQVFFQGEHRNMAIAIETRKTEKKVDEEKVEKAFRQHKNCCFSSFHFRFEEKNVKVFSFICLK